MTAVFKAPATDLIRAVWPGLPPSTITNRLHTTLSDRHAAGYRDDTLILETERDTADGRARVVDFMPPSRQAANLVRMVEGMSGTFTMHTRVRLRFDYGSIPRWVRRADREYAAIAGPDAAWLRAGVPLDHHDGVLDGDFTVAAGDRVEFVLTHQLSYLPHPEPADAGTAMAATSGSGAPGTAAVITPAGTPTPSAGR